MSMAFLRKRLVQVFANRFRGNALVPRGCSTPPVTCTWHHGPVDSDWDRFISRCQQALGELVQGRPEPFKALWSHADDVVIMGAFGGYERGWDQVSARLDWAAAGIKATDRAADNVVTVVGDDLAYTVDLEHMTRHAGGHPTPRTLRCTQAYRRENGEWKVILRHADELPSKDEQQR
jgi:ketosteroid isomerase-like protein